MPTAGYSGTPLPQKLGIKAGSVLAVLSAPDGFDELLELPPAVDVRRSARGRVDVVVAFVTARGRLESGIDAWGRCIFPDGGLWIAFPKKASGVTTDMTDHVVREVALPLGLVDNKVCAIDETWTGVRVVWRKERRTG
jgi:hypothetical protein